MRNLLPFCDWGTGLHKTWMRPQPWAGFADTLHFPDCAFSNLSAGLMAQRAFQQDLWLKISLWSPVWSTEHPLKMSSLHTPTKPACAARGHFLFTVHFCGHSRPQLWNTADSERILLNILVSLTLLPSRYSTKHSSLSRDWGRFLSGVHAPRSCVFDAGSKLRNTWACMGLSDWDGQCCCKSVGQISLTLEGEWLLIKYKAKPETDQTVSCLDT